MKRKIIPLRKQRRAAREAEQRRRFILSIIAVFVFFMVLAIISYTVL